MKKGLSWRNVDCGHCVEKKIISLQNGESEGYDEISAAKMLQKKINVPTA